LPRRAELKKSAEGPGNPALVPLGSSNAFREGRNRNLMFSRTASASSLAAAMMFAAGLVILEIIRSMLFLSIQPR